MRVRFFLSSVFTLLILLSILVAGCTSTPNAGQSPATFPEPHSILPVTTTGMDALSPPEVESVVDANNQFAFDLYRKLKDDPSNSGKNIFFSPFSISSAMAITYEGAHGKTADEIQSVFHFPDNETTMRQGYSGLFATLKANNKNASSLMVANALWAEKTYPFLPEYTRTADLYYNAKTTNIDIKNNPDASVDTINWWVEERTNGTIHNILSKDDIDPKLTRLIITNSIYFSGTWVKKFGRYDTYPEPFRISPNNTVNVQMMFRGSGNNFNYLDSSDMQAIELPYKDTPGHNISMLVILPKNDDLQSVEKALNASEFNRIRHSLETQEVGYVMLPKYSIESRYSLPTTLESMGMPTAFTLDADFSGMDGYQDNLYIDNVIHKTFIDVDEDGTQAAASTAVSMKSQGGHEGLPFFYANHPFLFIIQDRDNGNILFIGRVMNPNEV
jgi:serpin B